MARRTGVKSLACALGAIAAIGLGFLSLSAGQDLARDDVLRLHVLANSDDPEDQRVKLCVRDAVIHVFSNSGAQQDALESEQWALAHQDEIKKAALDTLQSEGKDYGVTVMIGRYAFPEKEYNGEVYPAGDYQAVRVILGEGSGQNWWCVLFPPLCYLQGGLFPQPSPSPSPPPSPQPNIHTVIPHSPSALLSASPPVSVTPAPTPCAPAIVEAEVPQNGVQVRSFLWEWIMRIWK